MKEPVVVALTRSGEETGRKVADLLGSRLHGRRGRVGSAEVHFSSAVEHVRDLFAAGVPVIGVFASGILIRSVAPLLKEKSADPPVISISEDGSVVVPLLGGHKGANRLAEKIAGHLDSIAAITTAGELSLGVALDEPPPGYRLSNPADVLEASASLLSGAGVSVVGENIFNLEHAGGDVEIVVSERPVESSGSRLVYHPVNFVVGVGCSRNADARELWDLVSDALERHGIAGGAVACVATIDIKADEPAVNEVARRLSVPLRVFSAKELEAQTKKLANPSKRVFAEVGCHGVCEGAALASGGELVAEKRKTANSTCAISRLGKPLVKMPGRSRGLLSVVGIGPGQSGWRTPEVSGIIAEADELVGYGLYLDLLGPLAAGKTRVEFPLGQEEERCRYALERAGEGLNVALVCSGDAGIYAMGALVFELIDRPPEQMGVSGAARRAEVVCSPGVSALQAAAARAGAPLGHDFCAISLSDLLTPREVILRRVRAAAQAGFVVAFYNPVSKTRRALLAEACNILLCHRSGETPVMLASNLGREEEKTWYRRLDQIEVDEIDMLTILLVGSENTRLVELGEGPRMYTPRGYARKLATVSHSFTEGDEA
ncbi:MAG: precorrin-3B C(17)-methyltransferase [Roseovarius sp.]|nr:precorrin-3B C(17)-methyltransferase [Roseovarius sp.]